VSWLNYALQAGGLRLQGRVDVPVGFKQGGGPFVVGGAMAFRRVRRDLRVELEALDVRGAMAARSSAWRDARARRTPACGVLPAEEKSRISFARRAGACRPG